MLMTTGVFYAGGRPDAGKRLVASQPDGFVFREVGPLDRKTHEALGVGLPHIERQKHNIRPADGPDGDQP
jgi:hypothetical protein